MGYRVGKSVGLIISLNIILLACVSSESCPPKGGAPAAKGKCPKDALKLGVCGSWLGLISEQIGAKPSKKCCTLLEGLADVEAAFCLCTVLNQNLVGVVQFEVPVALSLLLNSCGRKVPQAFVCP